MKNYKVLLAAAIVSTVLLGSCKKDDPVNDPNNPGTSGTQLFSIKTATIVYDFVGITRTLYFDNNGAEVCIDDSYGMSYVSDERYIWDGSAKKGYHLDTTNKTYQEVTEAEVKDELDMFLFTEQDYSVAGFTKTTQTIAGKSCSVYTGPLMGSNVTMGGWSGILFVMTVDGSDLLRAKSCSETVPANIFKVPSGYTKQ